GEQPRPGPIRVEPELVAHDAVGDAVVGAKRRRVDARVDGDEHLVGDRPERGEQRGHLGRWLAGQAADRERHGCPVRPRRRGTRAPRAPGQAPTAWTPPSTWTISPVVAGNQSDRSATHALATGSGSVIAHPS